MDIIVETVVISADGHRIQSHVLRDNIVVVNFTPHIICIADCIVDPQDEYITKQFLNCIVTDGETKICGIPKLDLDITADICDLVTAVAKHYDLVIVLRDVAAMLSMADANIRKNVVYVDGEFQKSMIYGKRVPVVYVDAFKMFY